MESKTIGTASGGDEILISRNDFTITIQGLVEGNLNYLELSVTQVEDLIHALNDMIR
jgi:hypothetical protein